MLELRPSRPTSTSSPATSPASSLPPPRRHGSDLRLKLDPDPMEIECDPERVAQVVRILLDNALIHTPSGTGVVVSAARENGQVRLEVSDSGLGIRRQTMPTSSSPSSPPPTARRAPGSAWRSRASSPSAWTASCRPLGAGRHHVLADAPGLMRRVLADAGLAGLIGGCGGGDSSDSGRSIPPRPDRDYARRGARAVRAERGRAQHGLRPAPIYRDEAPGVVTVISLFGGAGLDSILGGENDEGAGGVGSGFVVSPQRRDRDQRARRHPARATQIRARESGLCRVRRRQPGEAKIVGHDPNADIALLKSTPRASRCVRCRSAARDVQVGTPVAAIGSPFGERVAVGRRRLGDRPRDRLADEFLPGGIQTERRSTPATPAARSSTRRQVIGIDQRSRPLGRGQRPRLRGARRHRQAVARRAARGRGGALRLPRRRLCAAVPGARRALRPAGRQGRLGPGRPAPARRRDQAGIRGGSGDTRFQIQSLRSRAATSSPRSRASRSRDANDLSSAVAQFQPGQEVDVEVHRGDDTRKTIKVKLGERPLFGARQPSG